MPGSDAIERAARLIREGRLVAFPTETVYGLGANAFDAEAVSRIFAVKRRPATSPLIVHVHSIAMARTVARAWPEEAQRLAARFWPGPLTLVLEKAASIPDRVTAGLDTVGIRVPSHPAALALIRAANVPIAAPSANEFMRLSPTEASHVAEGLADMVLDGGCSEVGLESTVLSLAGGRRVLLRPGAVTREAIEAVIGPIEAGPATVTEGPHSSPGQHRRHYSPHTPLFLVRAGGELPRGRGVWVWHRRRLPAAHCVEMPATAQAYGAALYRTLHRLDGEDWDWIAVEAPPEGAEWAAVRDRLLRAAAGTTEEK